MAFIKNMKLYDLEKSLIEDLQGNIEDIRDNKYPDDVIREYVDSAVPVMNYDLLKMASDELWLGVEEPEIMAFDGTNTAVNAIAGNIYAHLMEIATKWADDNKIS